VLTQGLDLAEGSYWIAELASDLRYPQYKMSLVYALGRRLYANYVYLFGVLLIGWLFKIKLHPQPATSWHQFVEQAAIGGIPGWVTLLALLLFALHVLVLVAIGRRHRGGRDILHPHGRQQDGEAFPQQ